MPGDITAETTASVDSEFTTSTQLSIYPVYEGHLDSNDGYRQELAGHRVTNTLSVETGRLLPPTSLTVR